MKMPQFNGEIRDYQRFKSDFRNQVLPEIRSKEAACYALMTCLDKRSQRIVKNIDDNISEMWERLDTEYGQASKLADVIMHEIKKLKIVREGEDKRFLHLVDTVEAGYRDLKRAGIERERFQTQPWLASLKKDCQKILRENGHEKLISAVVILKISISLNNLWNSC